MHPEWNRRQTLLQINNTHNLRGLFKVELKFHLYSMYIETKTKYFKKIYVLRKVEFFMKKKYVAVMLGLVLSMSTASVYAAEEYAEEISKKADTVLSEFNLSEVVSESVQSYEALAQTKENRNGNGLTVTVLL